MRIAYLLFLVPVLVSSGCAGAIARAGTDPTDFKTKEEVHAKFGEPYSKGTEDGAVYEDYFTRQKIASRQGWDEGYVMLLFMTFGTIDLFLVPQELCLTTKRTIAGQTLRFTYDNLGNVIKWQRDGNADEIMWRNHQHKDTHDDVPVSTTQANGPLPLPSIPPLP
jgi:YD repeat-containing protein